MAIAVDEEGDDHAVDERDVTGDGDGAAEARCRSGDAELPEREVNAGASLLILSDGGGT